MVISDCHGICRGSITPKHLLSSREAPSGRPDQVVTLGSTLVGMSSLLTSSQSAARTWEARAAVLQLLISLVQQTPHKVLG